MAAVGAVADRQIIPHTEKETELGPDFGKLSPELILKIIKESQDPKKTSLVCRTFRDISEDREVYDNLFEKLYDDLFDKGEKEVGIQLAKAFYENDENRRLIEEKAPILPPKEIERRLTFIFTARSVTYNSLGIENNPPEVIDMITNGEIFTKKTFQAFEKMLLTRYKRQFEGFAETADFFDRIKTSKEPALKYIKHLMHVFDKTILPIKEMGGKIGKFIFPFASLFMLYYSASRAISALSVDDMFLMDSLVNFLGITIFNPSSLDCHQRYMISFWFMYYK